MTPHKSIILETKMLLLLIMKSAFKPPFSLIEDRDDNFKQEVVLLF